MTNSVIKRKNIIHGGFEMWVGLLVAVTFIVNDGGDGHDLSPGDGVCLTAGGMCTFRAAVEEASALVGSDTIAWDSSLTRSTLSPALGNVTIADTVYVLGKPSRDTLDCGGLSLCLSSGASGVMLSLSRVVLERADTAIRILPGGGVGALILDSVKIASSGPVLHTRETVLRIRFSTLQSSGPVAVIWQNFSASSLPLDTLEGSAVQSSGTCLHIEGHLASGWVYGNVWACNGYGVYTVSGYTYRNVTLQRDTFDMGNIQPAILLQGGNRWSILENVLRGTGGGGFLQAIASVRLVVSANRIEAGGGNLMEFNDVDSSRIENNWMVFPSLQSTTGGVVLLSGSREDTLLNNRYGNMEWAAIGIFDSSSNVVIDRDSLFNTGGIVIRPHWSGRYWTPFLVGNGNLPPSVGNNIVVRRVRVHASGSPGLSVVGFTGVMVDSSYIEDLSSSWPVLVFVAGGEAIFRGDTLRGPGDGYGISVEWFYGDSDDASTSGDDDSGRVALRGVRFENLFAALRLVDLDSSHLRVDTLWGVGYGNALTNVTWTSERLFLTLVQVFNNACGSLAGVDSVRLVGPLFGATLGKRKDDEGLFAHHWEGVPYTHYDSLQLWTLTPAERVDAGLTSFWASAYTVEIYGGNASPETHVVNFDFGLNTHLDPCPGGGRPKSVGGRWMVIKVQSSYATPVMESRESRDVYPFQIWRLGNGRVRVFPMYRMLLVDPVGRVRTLFPHRGVDLRKKGVYWIVYGKERYPLVLP